MFELSSVYFSYGEKAILKDFSLTVNDGECVALSGPSGCGKTTAAMILCGILKAQSGTVKAPDRIAVVFQDDRLIDNLSVSKNIYLAVGKEKYPFAKELLKKTGLYDDRHKKISELSGGMKRRAAIVRAVAFGGEGIILDEAFNGIDPENKRICAEIIKEAYKDKPVLIISHVSEDAGLLGAKQIIMNKTDDE